MPSDARLMLGGMLMEIGLLNCGAMAGSGGVHCTLLVTPLLFPAPPLPAERFRFRLLLHAVFRTLFATVLLAPPLPPKTLTDDSDDLTLFLPTPLLLALDNERKDDDDDDGGVLVVDNTACADLDLCVSTGRLLFVKNLDALKFACAS